MSPARFLHHLSRLLTRLAGAAGHATRIKVLLMAIATGVAVAFGAAGGTPASITTILNAIGIGSTPAATTPAASTTAPSIGKFQTEAATAAAALPTRQTPFLQVLSYGNSIAGACGITPAPATTAIAHCPPQAGDQVTHYHWLLNYDNTGDPNGCLPAATNPGFPQGNCPNGSVSVPGADDPRCHPSTNPTYPDGSAAPATPVLDPKDNIGACPWPSIHYETASPVISEGTEADWFLAMSNNGTPQPGNPRSKVLPPANCPAQPAGTHVSCNGPDVRGLPPGKYLVSVTADGYEIGGAHFTVNDWRTGQMSPAIVTVGLNPLPIPLGTIRARAFSDSQPTSSSYQVTDPPLEGFHPTIVDFDGIVSVDYYGSPLCTQYVTDANGKIVVNEKGSPTPLDASSPPVGTLAAPGVSPSALKLGAPIAVGTALSQITLSAPLSAQLTTGTALVLGSAPGVTFLTVNANTAAGQTVVPVDVTSATANYAAGTAVDEQRTQITLAAATTAALPAGSVLNIVNGAGTIQRVEVASLVKPGATTVPIAGEVFTASFGAGSTVRWTLGGACQTGPDGIVTIPNMPPNHYAVSLIPPTGQQSSQGHQWIQSYTLEGNHDIDVWVQPGDQGLDTEQIVAGEPVPFVDLAFVPGGVNLLSGGAGSIKGQIYGAANYVPGVGGIPGAGGNSGFSGIKLDRPVVQGWAALTDNNMGGDGLLVYSTAADGQGNFAIPKVPDGDYTLTVWDQPQDYALDQFNVTVSGGTAVDVGVLPLLKWHTRLDGKVCVDLNGNGRCDPGEPGVPNFLMQNLNRTNNQYEGGQNIARTDLTGKYSFVEAYPLGQFNVLQYFNTRYKTTGITYQACNDPQEHTIVSAFVDVSYLPIIGQCGRIDVAVQPYDPGNGDNGFIVATALYDSIRVTYPARQTVQFDHLVGIPGIAMDLYSPVPCPTPQGSAQCTAGTPNQSWLLAADGSYAIKDAKTSAITSADKVAPASEATALQNQGNDPATVVQPGEVAAKPSPMQEYITEHYGPPAGCTPQDANGNPIPNPAPNTVAGPGQQDSVKNPAQAVGYSARCTESSITGVGIGGGTDNLPTYAGGANHGIQTVDGNYSLGNTDATGCPAGTRPPASGGGVSGCYQNYPGDFIVHADIPADHVLQGASGTYDRPLYRMSNEEDININSGDQWVPQDSSGSVIWPPVPDPARQQAVGPYQENPGTSSPGPDPQCTGPQFTVKVTNPDFLAIGGSPFQNQSRNLCDSKLIHVENGQSVAPNFHFVTTVDVPIPGKFSGYLVDDVSASTDRKSTNLGEVSGIAGAPVGFYDWAGNLQLTTLSDYNGQFEALMPSTQISNCLTPAGVCPNVYRLVGNDPGQFPNPNAEYKPVYRTIAANFQSWPGQFLAADVAPSKAITNLEAAGAQFNYPPECKPTATQPQIFAVDKPYRFAATHNPSQHNPTLTITGAGFGAVKGTVKLGSTLLTGSAITSWNGTQIKVTVPDSLGGGTYQLDVVTAPVAAVGASPAIPSMTTAQGLTYHVIGGSYNPTIAVVGPQNDPRVQAAHGGGSGVAAVFDGTSKPRGADIQAALEWAAGFSTVPDPVTNGLTGTPAGKAVDKALIIVYPADVLRAQPTSGPIPYTPALSSYYENLIIHSPVQLQGVGPGGIDPVTGKAVQGTKIDGAFFWSTNTLPDANADEATAGIVTELSSSPNEPYAAAWLTLAEGINSVGGEGSGWVGNTNIIEGQVVYGVASSTAQYTRNPNFPATMDGFQITGGDQKDFPGNINEAFGNKGGPLQEFGNTDELPGVLQTQGGGIFLNAFTDHFHISNNLIQGNSGAYGGAIRIGTPYVNSGAAEDGAGQSTTGVVIARNQILGNGGTNLAGGIGLFSGTNGYAITQNVICGNYSLEYGGGISHFGLSGVADPAHPTPGKITDNRIFLNGANDEGGGITIAGELPLPGGIPAGGGAGFGGGLSPGAGPVDIERNYIGSNLSDDDGGGVRYLMAGKATQNVVDNMITNNVSAHEGGGISIDDTPNIVITNDTVARNITTATAVTSNGSPEPAGISTARNSNDLQATLPAGSPIFSRPTVQGSIVWGNLAGTWSSGGVVGLGLTGDATPVDVWDMGTVDGSGTLTPTYTLTDQPGVNGGYTTGGTGDVVDTGADQACPTSATQNNFPLFKAPFCTQIDLVSIRTYFRFRPAAIAAVSLPAGDGLGDYHLQGTASPAADRIPKGLSWTPGRDVDLSPRPTNGADPGIEIGAAEIHP